MTGTEIAIREQGAMVTERDVVDGWIAVAADVSKLSDYIAETEFVPKALRNKPAAIAACILTGRELGIGPMASLKSIHMVQGTPSLSAEYKRARALAAGHQIIIAETNATRCIVRGRRAGADGWTEITWTMDMAKRAKLAVKEVWQAYPQRMLQARATAELCDLLFPDATLGLPTTEELEDGGVVAEDGALVVPPAAAPSEPEQPKARTAQRKRQQPKPYVDDGSKGINPPPAPQPAAPGPALPPLPGEEEPAPPAAEERDYDSPGTVTTPQLTAIWTGLRGNFAFANEEKEQARTVCGQIIGRPLASTRDMSHNEAKAVLDTLANWRALAESNDEAPRDVMLAQLAALGGSGE